MVKERKVKRKVLLGVSITGRTGGRGREEVDT